MYDLQKASVWKRVSAFLLDGILLGILAVLFAYFLSAVLGYDGYSARLDARYAAYEAEYGVNFHMTLSEHESMTEEQQATLEKAYQALSDDAEAVYAHDMLISLTLLITSIGIFLAFLALEFFVPLIIGNGQTLGKKVFGIALMRTDGVRVSRVALFVRTVLCKYAIETMIPALILVMMYFGVIGVVGPVVLLLIFVVELVLIIATRDNLLLHDLLAATVAVDMASQMIFDSKEDMLAFKQKAQAEKVARQAY